MDEEGAVAVGMWKESIEMRFILHVEEREWGMGRETVIEKVCGRIEE